MASGVTEAIAGELTGIAGDVEMLVESEPSSSEILFVSLPPRIGPLFRSKNDDCHRYFLPTNSSMEEIIISSVTDFKSSCAKTENEKVNSRCLSGPLDDEL